MAVTINPGDTVVFAGDSITARGWYLTPGGFLDQLREAIGPGNLSSTTGALSASSGALSRAHPVTAINSGVSGNKIGDLNVASQIAPYRPDVVVMEYGVNDVFPALTDPATFQTTYDARLDSIAALTPAPQVMILNILCYGEEWAAGPAWASSTENTGIASLNTRIATEAAAHSATLVDQRANLLTWEAANNAPAPGANGGEFCFDTPGVHPNTAGEVLMGTWAMAGVTPGP